MFQFPLVGQAHVYIDAVVVGDYIFVFQFPLVGQAHVYLTVVTLFMAMFLCFNSL